MGRGYRNTHGRYYGWVIGSESLLGSIGAGIITAISISLLHSIQTIKVLSCEATLTSNPFAAWKSYTRHVQHQHSATLETRPRSTRSQRQETVGNEDAYKLL